MDKLALKARYLLSTLLIVVTATAKADLFDNELMRAMRDEMVRTTNQLSLPGAPKTYFVSYQIEDLRSRTVSASGKSLLTEGETHLRFLIVELRVGNYEFDNSNFFNARSRPGDVRRRIAIPIDDQYDEIRRQIWLATDALYKGAVESYTEKKAIQASMGNTETLADFSKQESVQMELLSPALEIPMADLRAMATKISSAVNGINGLESSKVELLVNNRTTYYLNSEGTAYTLGEPALHYFASLSANTEDGYNIHDFDSLHVNAISDLPAPDTIASSLKSKATALVATKKSKRFSDIYVGPVLFEEQAAAELVLQTLAPNLIAQRTALIANPLVRRQQQIRNATAFNTRLNTRVLPDFLSIVDNPEVDTFNGKQLFGHHEIDDEGVATRKNVLVDNGRFVGFLGGRMVAKGYDSSAGSVRGGIPIPSNLFVEATDGTNAKQLRSELINQVKLRDLPFGIVIKRISNPRFDPARIQNTRQALGINQMVVGSPTQAYKIYPNGKEELIRNAEVQGFTLASYRDIMYAGDAPFTYTAPFFLNNNQVLAQRYALTGQQNDVLVASVITPSLFFEEMTIAPQSQEADPLPSYAQP